MKKLKRYTYLLLLSLFIGVILMWYFEYQVIRAVIVIFLIGFMVYYGYFIHRNLFAPIEKAIENRDYDFVTKEVSKVVWETDQIEPYEMIMITKKFLYPQINSLNVEMLQKKMEYTALQSQINPHFLYNTLETIRGQAIIDGNKEIAEMVERLSSFFRYSISQKGEVVTLRDELNNIRNYMKIMEFRFFNRYSFEIEIDEDDRKAYDYYVPRLILQPIVENAIQHGLEDKISGGLVCVEVTVADDLIITVSDNGAGMSLEQLDQLNAKIHSEAALHTKEGQQAKGKKGTGIALSNVNKRIQLLYGMKYGVNVYSSENCGTDVEIVLPIVDEMERTDIEKDRIKD